MIDPAQALFAPTRLKTTSVLRLHKLATLHSRSLARFLGRMPPAPLGDVRAKLRALLNF